MPADTTDISNIAGNSSPEVKTIVARTLQYYFRGDSKGYRFGDAILARLSVSEVSVQKKADEPSKEEARVVCEIIVEEDMLNGGGNVHGGCSAYLIDICSTLPIMALAPATNVSQSLNIVYHSPASLGEKLRIVNTSMTIGARAMSARSEIWNATKHRLVASGVHIKMQPSLPKANL